VEDFPWAEPWARVTTALSNALAVLARELSWQGTAREYGLNWKSVATIVKRAVQYGLGCRSRSGRKNKANGSDGAGWVYNNSSAGSEEGIPDSHGWGKSMLQNCWIKHQLHVAILTAAITVSAGAQDQHSKGAILEKLEAQYVPTQTTDDKSDIVTAGSILTLKLDNLLTAGLSSGSICPNTYKDGRITQSALAKVTCGRAASVAGQVKRRTFLAGQKLWVTAIDVKDGGVVFELYTDAYAGERYKATLTFPFAKGSLPAPAEVQGTVAQVFKADPPPQPAPTDAGPGAAQPAVSGSLPPGGGAPNAPPPAQPAPQPAVEDKPLPPIDAPPPPPAEPKTINLGMTTQEVVASFGNPERIVKLGTKEIYSYKDLKVTFVNNKVTDVQ
jgi:hypothetical protein